MVNGRTSSGPVCVQVVEELLSRSGALGKETAKSIADAAMLEVASISMGHMVRALDDIIATVIAARPSDSDLFVVSSQEPDEFYEGITFEHFLKVCCDLETLIVSFGREKKNTLSPESMSTFSSQLLSEFEIEAKMNIRFWNMDATTMCK